MNHRHIRSRALDTRMRRTCQPPPYSQNLRRRNSQTRGAVKYRVQDGFVHRRLFSVLCLGQLRKDDLSGNWRLRTKEQHRRKNGCEGLEDRLLQ